MGPIATEVAAGSPTLLRLDGVTKVFGGVTALRDVSFDLRAGEVHALLGENGAGKSTLIKVLAGIVLPDSGSIHIDGWLESIRGVPDADRLGIRVIHQELSLAPNLSVAENIFLGREPHVLGWLGRRRMVVEARAHVARLGLHEIQAVETPVWKLSAASRQLVEIARALSTDARILILDEPTSSLSGTETSALFETLRRLRSSGAGIIYISHRLEEVLRLADRISVLRDGRSIGTRSTAAVDQRELVRWMVDREITDRFHRPAPAPGSVVLEARGLDGPRVHDVSFALHQGEVLGLAGLVGSGRSELARTLFGLDPLLRGEVLVDGKSVRIRCPRDALERGIVLVPEDRRKEGLVMAGSLAFNVALPWTRLWNPAFLPNRRRRREIVERAVRSFRIKASHIDAAVGTLSGGNQQKALVGRWMEKRPRVLILDEPTRGVDVGAREEMFLIIGSLVEEGMAVLLISSDLEEVLQMSHRVAVYRDGRILRTAPAVELSAERVMALLTGADGGGEAA